MKWFDDPKELKKRRKAYGLSQSALAAHAGMTRQLIADIESGRRQDWTDVRHQLWDAIAEVGIARRANLEQIKQAAKGETQSEDGPKQIKDHNFNVKPCKTGGYNLEYQGPGMPVCEDYHFATGTELMQFMAKVMDALPEGQEMVLKSDMMSKQAVEE